LPASGDLSVLSAQISTKKLIFSETTLEKYFQGLNESEK